jgi:hypothetical protein
VHPRVTSRNKAEGSPLFVGPITASCCIHSAYGTVYVHRGLASNEGSYAAQSTYIYRVPQCMPLVGIGTLPPPFSPASVPLPPETGGRGHTSLRLGGWGESQFRRGAYTVVLFICTYFVICWIKVPPPPGPSNPHVAKGEGNFCLYCLE